MRKDLKPTIVYFDDFDDIPPSTVFHIIFLNVGHNTFISVVKMSDKLISEEEKNESINV